MPDVKAIAVRAFRRNGKRIAKNARITLTEGEFEQLEPVGLVKRARARKISAEETARTPAT